MQFKAKGIITAICDIKTTKMGTAVQQIHFEAADKGRLFYPSALGTKIEILTEFLPGDCVEIEFHISGSKGTYNNVIIDNLVRL